MRDTPAAFRGDCLARRARSGAGPGTTLRHIAGWIVLALLLLPATSSAGFRIQNGRLVDDSGAPFVTRGINYPFAWYTSRYPTQTQQDFANMAATRATGTRTGAVTVTGGGLTRTISVAQNGSGSQQPGTGNWNGASYPVCVNDNAGWGFKSNTTCISRNLRETQSGGPCNWWGALYPACVNDNEGWGWENNRKLYLQE